MKKRCISENRRMPRRMGSALFLAVLMTGLHVGCSTKRNSFPGYEPKTSPDTIADYRPSLHDQVEEQLRRAGVGIPWIEYPAVAFYHADVMGSGRFFYAKEPKVTRIRLSR